MGVGERVWERFGHNAILVEDHARGTSKAYNYGLFDFNQENFILRFVQGRMLYWMQGFDLEPTLQVYVRTNRTVWVQELDLTPAERVALQRLSWSGTSGPSIGSTATTTTATTARPACATRSIACSAVGSARPRTPSRPDGATGSTRPASSRPSCRSIPPCSSLWGSRLTARSPHGRRCSFPSSCGTGCGT